MSYTPTHEHIVNTLHVILRKDCDSKWASLLWNSFHMTDEAILAEFISFLAMHYQTMDGSVTTTMAAFRNFDYNQILTNRYRDSEFAEHQRIKEIDRRLQMDNEVQWRANQCFTTIVNMISEEDARDIYGAFEYWHQFTQVETK